MFDLHPMRALFLMSKSGYKPPTLKDKARWSSSFHAFTRECLTKNPKKRPSARKMLEHPHMLSMDLTKRLAVDLLAQVQSKTLLEKWARFAHILSGEKSRFNSQ